MTEDEALQKWCPFSRVNFVGSDDMAIIGNRMEKHDSNELPLPKAAMCLGSKCMAWQENLADENQGVCGLTFNVC